MMQAPGATVNGVYGDVMQTHDQNVAIIQHVQDKTGVKVTGYMSHSLHAPSRHDDLGHMYSVYNRSWQAPTFVTEVQSLSVIKA